MKPWLALAVLLPALSVADETADLMTRGKVAADLGKHAEAARAFEAVAASTTAAPAVRAEALIRLGSARRAARDLEGSVRAFERAAKHPGLDREAKALLVQAIGGAVPDPERWNDIWTRVTFVVDRSDTNNPGLAVRWPDAPKQAAVRQFTGEPISLDLKDGDILDVLRLFADMGGVNVFVDPAVRGKVTLKVHEMPWDEALDRLLKTNGYRWQRDGDVVLVHHGEMKLPPKKTYTGRPIALDLKNGDVHDVMHLLAETSNQNIAVFAPGEGYKVSLKLRDMPLDHVLDVLLATLRLQSRREGGVLWISTADFMPPVRTYTGKPIDVQVEGQLSSKEAIEQVIKAAGADVTLEPRPATGSRFIPFYVNLRLKQVPWDQALDLVARTQLHEVIADGDRLVVRPVGWTSGDARAGFGFRRFRVAEVKLLGVLNQKGEFTAVMQGPDGKGYWPRVGQKLHDGNLVAIDAESVTFEEKQDDGATRQVKKTIDAWRRSAGPSMRPD